MNRRMARCQEALDPRLGQARHRFHGRGTYLCADSTEKFAGGLDNTVAAVATEP